MPKKVIVLLAEGFEEVETVTPFTYLRRAGIGVTSVAIGKSLSVNGARGIKLVADTTIAEISQIGAVQEGDDWDAVILPGGLKGAENLAACEKTGALLKNMASAGKLICAICASPALVLSPLGLLEGKKFTCYPEFEKKATGGNWSEDRVVVDGNFITSRAAGTAGEFALAIIEKLLDKETAKKIADQVLL